MLSGLSGFGAFNSKQDYQYGIVAKGKIVEKLGGAKKLTILFSQYVSLFSSSYVYKQ